MIILKNLFNKNPEITSKIDVHLILGPNTPLSNRNHINNSNNIITKKYAVPSNFHLNVARFFSRTEFIFLLDHDTWPYSPGMYGKIKNHYTKHLVKNNIIILPTFVFTNNSSSITSSVDQSSQTSTKNDNHSNSVDQIPNNRNELIRLIKDGKMALLDKGWELNNGPTSLSKFMKRENNLLYKLETYDFYYKPNFIVKKDENVPW